MESHSPTVELTNVSVKYEDKVVLAPLDLVINPTERWVVLGPNGSGKTSLIKILSLYRYPTSGTVRVLGETWGATDIRELRRRIGLASSSLRDQFRADISAFDIVMTARFAALETWWHDYTEADRSAALGCLQRVGADLLRDRKFHTLSSGEQQRVQLARTLMGDPGLLLLDEPTASLDPEVGDFVRTFLEDYKKEKKISILLASHNMNEVTRLCKSVLMMKNGEIIDQGKPEDLITKHGRTNLEEVFLELVRNKNEFN